MGHPRKIHGIIDAYQLAHESSDFRPRHTYLRKSPSYFHTVEFSCLCASYNLCCMPLSRFCGKAEVRNDFDDENCGHQVKT